MKIYILLLISLSISRIAISQNVREDFIDSAKFYGESGSSYQALKFFKLALGESEKSSNRANEAYDLLQVGFLQLREGEMNNSISSYFKALEIIEKNNCHDSLKFKVLNQICYYYIEFDELDEAGRYLEMAKKVAKKNDSNEMYHSYYTRLGVLERRRGNYEASIRSYKRALELIDTDDHEPLMDALLSLGAAYMYNSNFPNCINALEQAEVVNEQLKSNYYSIATKGQIGKAYALNGDQNRAISYYLEALEIAEEMDHTDFTRRLNRELARSYSKLKNYKEAHKHYTVFVKYLEESVDQQKTTAIKELSVKYQYEKKEQELTHLSAQKELEGKLYDEEINRQQVIIWFSAFGIVLIVVIAIFIFRSQRTKQRIQLQLLENEKKLVRQEAILSGQEAERNRLSQELHDGLGGALASIKLRLSDQREQNLESILDDLDQACQEVRNVSHSLNSCYIQASDFYTLLERFTSDFEKRTGIIVQFDFLPKDKLNALSEEIRHNCFRIIQELSNNVLKHSKANHFTVGLLIDDEDVLLLIEDDGVGCDLTKLSSNGIGLQNIRDRVRKLNGDVEIDSQIGKGMTFSIKFPFA